MPVSCIMQSIPYVLRNAATQNKIFLLYGKIKCCIFLHWNGCKIFWNLLESILKFCAMDNPYKGSPCVPLAAVSHVVGEAAARAESPNLLLVLRTVGQFLQLCVEVNVCREYLAEAKLRIWDICIYDFRAIAFCRPNEDSSFKRIY